MGINDTRKRFNLMGALLAALLLACPVMADTDGQPLKPMAPQIDPTADQAHRSFTKPLQASIQHNEQLGKPKPKVRPPVRAAVNNNGFFGRGREAAIAPVDPLKAKANNSNLAAEATSGYGIIGVKFVLSPGRPPIVNRVFAGTPAAKVGMQTEDAIVAVDGVPTMGLTKEEVYDLIIGSPGTNVTVSLMRGGSITVVTCTRMDINDITDPIVRRDYMLNM